MRANLSLLLFSSGMNKLSRLFVSSRTYGTYRDVRLTVQEIQSKKKPKSPPVLGLPGNDLPGPSSVSRQSEQATPNEVLQSQLNELQAANTASSAPTTQVRESAPPLPEGDPYVSVFMANARRLTKSGGACDRFQVTPTRSGFLVRDRK